ncbi:hypothetical protein AGLY_015747 [Aphis glycines]|uniref:Uncharacterized protein n=1 Tax=Aphis glycines TaxID=307491 RepID=A0A6G0SZV6_APHGL|nr:hypothetical protein AGLY_015747 [Aphis glycines]
MNLSNILPKNIVYALNICCEIIFSTINSCFVYLLLFQLVLLPLPNDSHCWLLLCRKWFNCLNYSLICIIIYSSLINTPICPSLKQVFRSTSVKNSDGWLFFIPPDENVIFEIKKIDVPPCLKKSYTTFILFKLRRMIAFVSYVDILHKRRFSMFSYLCSKTTPQSILQSDHYTLLFIQRLIWSSYPLYYYQMH